MDKFVGRLCLELRALGMILTVSLVAGATAPSAQADVAFEGFLPFVGMGLTDEYDTFDTSATFFIAEKKNAPGGMSLGPGNDAYYDIALLDTGAATHILTLEATHGFTIDAEGFDGTNYQAIGGATGIIELRINDPLGFYVAGMADRVSAGANLDMNRPAMRGQTNIATLSAPAEWTLPNIVGLPIAAQHAIHIKNSQPEIFELGGRTVRTPQIELMDLGAGEFQGITRRLPMNLNPGVGFIQGPLYIQNLDFNTLDFHENPLSPTIVENGGLFVDVDMQNGGDSIDDSPFLFDTGASLTVISQQTAVRLGVDPVLDEPDFELAVEGSGGLVAGIPGFYIEQLSFDSVGGSFAVTNVPVAVLDVTNPNDPGNVVPGIIGMNLFADRDLIIDANPSVGAGGNGPSIYISDAVTTSHAWGTPNVTGDWVVDNSWSAPGVPTNLWDAVVANVRGSDQEAILSTSSTVFRTTISGGPAAEMSVRVASGGRLVAFTEVNVQSGGRLHLDGGQVDAQYIQIEGGRLTGSGSIFVGSGPLDGSIRNFGGIIAPGNPQPDSDPIGTIEVEGDVVNLDGTMSFDLAGRTAGATYDRLEVDGLVFLSGVLDVGLADAGGGLFHPTIGDTFTIITSDEGISGTFDTENLPSGYSWNVSYTSTTVRLQVSGLGFLGDFDGDGQLNCTDINMLTSAVADSGGASFDLTGDGIVNQEDIVHWVTQLRGTLMGDANLDDIVNTADFDVWNSNRFTHVSDWCSGDFNGDGAIDVSDLHIWNEQRGQSAAVVPEPSTVVLLGLGWIAVARRTRRWIGR